MSEQNLLSSAGEEEPIVETHQKFGKNIQTGTFFMNRCDYLDPGLAWTGVKDTGMGVTLSVLGFDHLTRAKSYHLRKV